MCVLYLSMARRAPMIDVIPLGQTNTISRLPRQGWVIVTVTATCSSVSIPDRFRSAAETEGEERAVQCVCLCVCLTIYWIHEGSHVPVKGRI